MSTLARILISATTLVCLCMPQPALSAEFRKSSLGPKAPDLIEMLGELTRGDEVKFIEVAITSAGAIVVFHSGGGNPRREVPCWQVRPNGVMIPLSASRRSPIRLGTRMRSPFVNPKRKRTRLRPTHLAIAGLAAMIAGGDHVGATDRRNDRSVESIQSRTAGEPLLAIVSLHDQRITIYDANGWILRAPVSTGQKGRETPAGIFSVIQKEAENYSNLYDDTYTRNARCPLLAVKQTFVSNSGRSPFDPQATLRSFYVTTSLRPPSGYNAIGDEGE
jgi:hypothetical protein